jgi:hypothetical protein
MSTPNPREGILKRHGTVPKGNTPTTAGTRNLMTSASGTVLRGSKKDPSPGGLRNYASETKLSALVNQTGKFNSELKRTGFLGEAKMRARRIAQNPKRFLEAYADSHVGLEIVPTEVPELDSFIKNLTVTDRYVKKEEELEAKAEAAKQRTFLLSMASASSVELDTTEEFLDSYASGDGDFSDPVQMTEIVCKYLEELKCMDTETIEEWLSQ